MATRPDGTVHGGPDRATGDPRTVNEISAIYGTPDEVAKKLDELRKAGVGYVLINGGGSGGRACADLLARSCRLSPRCRCSGTQSDRTRFYTVR